MIEWLQSLSVLSQIYFWIAAAATLLLILQIVLMIFSFGGSELDTDIDTDIDFDADTDTGIGIFTLKGLTAFFTLGAWVGLLCSELFGKNLCWLSVFPALIFGSAAMIGMAFVMKLMLKLQVSGNLEKGNVEGKIATVYVSIQPSRTGRGKITLTAQGKFMELDAVTDEEEKLSVDERVIIEEFSNGTAVVKKIK